MIPFHSLRAKNIVGWDFSDWFHQLFLDYHFSINALAHEQKDEIMAQLDSIRKLVKESGLDKSAIKPQGAYIQYFKTSVQQTPAWC